ncbi:MAG TPA: helix-turn-helix domain-containing protein, partial [Polyangiaceae bacterium]|nr:helix-turn-helix domain-containing protein [Polyangiaceae bacterium]
MNLKIELVERASRGEPLAALCREFGISRTTRHKWVKRFRDLGYEGLEDRSKRPKNTPLATAEDVVIAVLELREAHPRWGPKKLQVVLQRRLGNDTPSERTIARILDRAGRVRERQRRRSISVVDRIPRVEAKEPNDVWTVDFKGWWRARNTQRCEPLTVRDAWSRFVLASVIVENTKTDTVKQVFIRLFKKHGVPKTIQVDNGSPFVCVRARAGLSTLSAWWISLGTCACQAPSDQQSPDGRKRP